MKTEKEIEDRIKDLKIMLKKDKENKELYHHWLDAMYWVKEEVGIKQ